MEGVKFASSILVRAVELDNAGRYTESLVCYQEGLNLLMESLKIIPEENTAVRSKLRAKVEEYMGRAEKLKKYIENLKGEGNYREQIQIKEDSRGHSYTSIFSRFLDNSVTEVEIDDPYIRLPHQCDNLLRFIELILKKCPDLGTVRLKTGLDNDHFSQKQRLETITKSLLKNIPGRKIVLFVNYSDSLHDREIRFNNGWVVKIGRGLDYFKPVDRLNVGFTEFDFRPCKETTVDVFHRKELVGVK